MFAFPEQEGKGQYQSTMADSDSDDEKNIYLQLSKNPVRSGKIRHYKYLQPCTHSGSDRKIRGENDSKRQIIIILFENEALF